MDGYCYSFMRRVEITIMREGRTYLVTIAVAPDAARTWAKSAVVDVFEQMERNVGSVKGCLIYYQSLSGHLMTEYTYWRIW